MIYIINFFIEYILNIVSFSQILQPHNPFNSWTFLSLYLENRQKTNNPPKQTIIKTYKTNKGKENLKE